MIQIPYGKTFIEFEEGDANVLCSSIGELKAEGDGLSIVKAAMEHPIDSPRLSELAAGKKNCVIIISDHTRPVPSKDILPNMIAELKEGSPDIDITLLVATGFHRQTTEAELRSKLGDEIYEQNKIVIHDCRDAARNVQIGVLPSGAPCVIDRVAAEYGCVYMDATDLAAPEYYYKDGYHMIYEFYPLWLNRMAEYAGLM